MNVNPKFVTSELALAIRAQAKAAVAGGFHDIDPELLYQGVEEEEEEEEEDEDEDEEGDDDDGDRGDDVDPALKPDDDADADADADAAGAGDDIDHEALAELASEGGKARMVPHARFNEVNESLKHERAERLRLEEELARANGREQEPAARGKADEAKPYDFDSAEDRYMDAVMEGNKDLAREIRSEIRSEERKSIEAESQKTAQASAESALKQRDEEGEAAALQKVAGESIAKYSFLDINSESANKDAIEDVVARRDYYMKQGMPPSKALATAVEKVAPRYAKKDEPAAKGSDVQLTAEQISRNIERERRIPQVPGGVGERGKEVDYSNLSEDEFDSLPESEKRKARGDFVAGA
ncbi:hypothetical protein [Aquipseudomonas campi]